VGVHSIVGECLGEPHYCKCYLESIRFKMCPTMYLATKIGMGGEALILVI